MTAGSARVDDRDTVDPRPASRPPLSTTAGLFLAGLHAVLFALAFPPVAAWPLVFLAPVPLTWWAIRGPATRRVLFVTLITQTLLWLWMHRWIMQVTPPGYPLLSLYFAAWGCGFAWVVRRVARRPGLRSIPLTLAVPLMWAMMDFLRGDVVLGGYPWFMLGVPLIEATWLAQVADAVGVYGCVWLAAMVAGLVLDWLRWHRDARNPPVRCTAAVAVSLAAALGYGAWRTQQTAVLRPGPTILAIQTNLPQSNKMGWSREDQLRDVPGFLNLTRQAVSGSDGDPDLIVWPETMMPSVGYEPQTLECLARFGETFEHLLRWPVEVRELSNELDAPMLVGTEAWIGASVVPLDDGMVRLTREREYNSAYLVQGGPPHQRYDKVVLTPFGERMPVISNWEWLEQKLLSIGAAGMSFDLDAAERPQLLHVDGRGEGAGFTMATPICFEDTVSWLCRTMAYGEGGKAADVFVNISNDGWFGWSHADRLLHVQVARWRCIENRLPMVRCVNTGLSAHVDSCGRVVAGVGAGRYGESGQPGWLQAKVALDSRHTLFARGGWLFPWVCLAAALGLVGWTWRSRTGLRQER